MLQKQTKERFLPYNIKSWNLAIYNYVTLGPWTNPQGLQQVFDFGEANNSDIFRGRGVLKHVFDLILKISARLFTIFYITLIYYIKHPISLIYVIILRINFRPSLCDFGWKIAIFLCHFNAFWYFEHQWNPPPGGGILELILNTSKAK